MGKKVPLKMNMGMMTKRKSVANGASLVWAAENAWMGAAKARPVSTATGNMATAWGRSVAPKATITARNTMAPTVRRRPTQTSCPVATWRAIQRRQDHGHVCLEPADAGHDRVGRFAGGRVHGGGHQDARCQEHHV